MALLVVTYCLLLTLPSLAHGRNCGKARAPFELGEFTGNLKHLDTKTIENNPVSLPEGQFYVYENTFPSYVIKYVTVDNVAQKTCGASTTLKRGGVGTSTILLIIHAEAHHEIRAVIDVWGEPGPPVKSPCKRKGLKRTGLLKNMRSKYLFMDSRAVNHNSWVTDVPADLDILE